MFLWLHEHFLIVISILFFIAVAQDYWYENLDNTPKKSDKEINNETP